MDKSNRATTLQRSSNSDSSSLTEKTGRKRNNKNKNKSTKTNKKIQFQLEPIDSLNVNNNAHRRQRSRSVDLTGMVPIPISTSDENNNNNNNNGDDDDDSVSYFGSKQQIQQQSTEVDYYTDLEKKKSKNSSKQKRAKTPKAKKRASQVIGTGQYGNNSILSRPVSVDTNFYNYSKANMSGSSVVPLGATSPTQSSVQLELTKNHRKIRELSNSLLAAQMTIKSLRNDKKKLTKQIGNLYGIQARVDEQMTRKSIEFYKMSQELKRQNRNKLYQLNRRKTLEENALGSGSRKNKNKNKNKKSKNKNKNKKNSKNNKNSISGIGSQSAKGLESQRIRNLRASILQEEQGFEPGSTSEQGVGIGIGNERGQLTYDAGQAKYYNHHLTDPDLEDNLKMTKLHVYDDSGSIGTTGTADTGDTGGSTAGSGSEMENNESSNIDKSNYQFGKGNVNGSGRSRSIESFPGAINGSDNVNIYLGSGLNNTGMGDVEYDYANDWEYVKSHFSIRAKNIDFNANGTNNNNLNFDHDFEYAKMHFSMRADNINNNNNIDIISGGMNQIGNGDDNDNDDGENENVNVNVSGDMLEGDINELSKEELLDRLMLLIDDNSKQKNIILQLKTMLISESENKINESDIDARIMHGLKMSLENGEYNGNNNNNNDNNDNNDNTNVNYNNNNNNNNVTNNENNDENDNVNKNSIENNDNGNGSGSEHYEDDESAPLLNGKNKNKNKSENKKSKEKSRKRGKRNSIKQSKHDGQNSQSQSQSSSNTRNSRTNLLLDKIDSGPQQGSCFMPFCDLSFCFPNSNKQDKNVRKSKTDQTTIP